jgi:hypothetical protein
MNEGRSNASQRDLIVYQCIAANDKAADENVITGSD